MVLPWYFPYVNLMSLWPFRPHRPLSLHNGAPLGHLYLIISILIYFRFEKRRMGNSLQQVITVPLCIGHHDTDTNGNIKYQDGYISSIMIFVVLFTLGICLGIGQYITTEQTKPIDKYMVEITMTIYMMLCIVFIVVVTCTKIQKKITKTKEEDQTSELQLSTGLKENDDNESRKKKMFEIFIKVLPLIGIVFFLLGVIALDVFRIIAYASCIGELGYYVTEAITSIIYHIVRICFATFITYFCCTFLYNDIIFRNIWPVRYGLMLLQACLLCIWGESQLFESKEIFESNTTGTSTQVFENQCKNRSNDNFAFSEDVGVYLFPLNVEFSLLVSECVLHIFLTMGKQREEGVANGRQKFKSRYT